MPLKRRVSVQVGILTKRDWTIGEWGECRLADVPDKKVRLYCHDDSWLDRKISRGSGSIHYWRGRAVKYLYKGRGVYSTRGKIGELNPHEAFESIRDWANWVRSAGGNVASLASSSFSIWRATLKGRVVCRAPTIEWQGWDAGGRQDLGVPPGSYDNCYLWDIRTAYPYTMHTTVLPRRFRRYRSCTLDGSCGGFARATVSGRGPGVYGPLPIKQEGRLSYPRTLKGDEGIWAISELTAAADRGYSVTIHDAWVGEGDAILFGNDWWEHVLAGRGIESFGSTLAKITSVCTWGGFICQGSGEWVDFLDGNPQAPRPDHRTLRPLCWPIAAMITAAVRARLYLQALTKVPVLACHTDGAIVADETLKPKPNGTEPGQWSQKAHAVRLDLVGPQVYRYTRSDGSSRSVVSGAPSHIADRVFSLILRQQVKENRWKVDARPQIQESLLSA